MERQALSLYVIHLASQAPHVPKKQTPLTIFSILFIITIIIIIMYSL